MDAFDPKLVGGLEDMADKMFDMSQRYFNMLKKNTKFEKSTANLQLFYQLKNITIEVIKVDFISDNFDDISYWNYIFEQIMLQYNYPMIGNKAVLNIINKIKTHNTNKNQKYDFVKVCLIRNLECRIFMKESYCLVYLRPDKPK